MSKHLLLCVLLVISLGCSAPNTAKQTPTATPLPKAATEERDASPDERERAIVTFVDREYAGWKWEGTSSTVSSCQWYEGCDLHLSKGKAVKVVRVQLQRFSNKQGETYWLVFEVRQIDLMKTTI